MTNLTFRFGSMNSRKSADLLLNLHQYRSSFHKKALLLKPATDTRNPDKVVARCGLSAKCDFIIKPGEKIETLGIEKNPIDAIFVDEAQWLTTEQVNDLWKLSCKINIFCYGIRTDFKGKLFEGSAALFALSDYIEHIQTLCAFCTHKAMYNLRLHNNQATFNGAQTVVDDGEHDVIYKQTCKFCVLNFQRSKVL
jgi:thymidine kinase